MEASLAVRHGFVEKYSVLDDNQPIYTDGWFSNLAIHVSRTMHNNVASFVIA